MNPAPKVSIIVPNYNYVRYLEERFRSILGQTFGDYEIIFLDDASTDGSVKLVTEKFKASLTRTEVNTTNSGNPFVQWNRGVRLGRGEYIWIAEADDVCTHDFLERLVQVLDANPTVGIAYCNTIPVNENGTILDANFHHRYVSDLDDKRWLTDFTAHGWSEVRNYLSRKNTITNVSSVLFRRDAFVQAGYAPEDMRMCGDWMMYCRVLHNTDVAYISTPMNFHRQHTAKHTRNSVLDLTYFREFLLVQRYLASAFDLNEKEKRAAFERFLGEWDRLTISHYGRINLERTVSLARMTASSYPEPQYNLEIFIHFLRNSLKSMTGKWRVQ